MFGLIGKLIATPGNREALIALMLDGTGQMPGNLSYIIARDPDDDDALWVTEVWENEEYHRASLSLPAVQKAISLARPIIAGFGESIRTEPRGGHGLVTASASPQAAWIPNRSMPPGAIIPVLAYDDVATAAEWLCATFGFRERLRIGNHRRQLVLNGESVIVISAAAGSRPPGDSVRESVMVRVTDVDAHYALARAAGARTTNPPETYPFGERQYSVQDIGGRWWTFSQSVADVAPDTWGGEMIDPSL